MKPKTSKYVIIFFDELKISPFIIHSAIKHYRDVSNLDVSKVSEKCYYLIKGLKQSILLINYI